MSAERLIAELEETLDKFMRASQWGTEEIEEAIAVFSGNALAYLAAWTEEEDIGVRQRLAWFLVRLTEIVWRDLPAMRQRQERMLGQDSEEDASDVDPMST
jgi:hypothetical protein